jgi:hypothetical protein
MKSNRPISLILILGFVFSTSTYADWPGVRLTPVLGVGDLAPGIPDSEIVIVNPPHVGADGVLVPAWYVSPITAGQGFWYGQPGSMSLVAREGGQAPGMPTGVILEVIEVQERLGEDGRIAFWGQVSGPGIVPFVNDFVVFSGYPGDIHPVLRSGDRLPGHPTGVMPGYSPGINVGVTIADDGTLGLEIWDLLVDSQFFPFMGLYVVTPNGLDPVIVTGMPAPGLAPGVLVECLRWTHMTNEGRVVLKLGLEGPGIRDDNNGGIWTGLPGKLEPVLLESQPVPGLDPSITLRQAHSPKGLNSSGEIVVSGTLNGPGITEENQLCYWGGSGSDLMKIACLGDDLPFEQATGTIAEISEGWLNEQGIMLPTIRATGPGISSSNDRWGLAGYFIGSRFDVTLWEGMPIPYSGDFVSLDNSLHFVSSDETHIAARTNFPNSAASWVPGTTILLSPDAGSTWRTVIRYGDSLDAKTVADVQYWTQSGGNDGSRYAMNDDGRLGLSVEFADGTEAAYVADPVPTGDSDLDGDLDLADFGNFQLCYTGPASPSTLDPPCEEMDLDSDGDIDLIDFAEFQISFTGAL